MVARLVRGNAYMRLSYDLTDNISALWHRDLQRGRDLGQADPVLLQVGQSADRLRQPLPADLVAQACLANNGQTAAYNSQFTSIAQPVGGIAGSRATPMRRRAANHRQRSGWRLRSPTASSTASPPARCSYGAQNSVLQNVENYNNRTTAPLRAGRGRRLQPVRHRLDLQGLLASMARSTSQHARKHPGHALLRRGDRRGAGDRQQPGRASPACRSAASICRSVAARSVGCAPLNIIGTTGASPAARSFVQGLNADGSSTGANGRDPWQIVNHAPGSGRLSAFPARPSRLGPARWIVATGFQFARKRSAARPTAPRAAIAPTRPLTASTYGPAGNPLLNPGSTDQRQAFPPAAPNWYAGNFQPARG